MCDRCIEWDGDTWHLWSKGYYERRQRLHREVWKSVNGPIPKGHDVHHKNGNRLDNRIDNLELLSKSEHSALHFDEHLRPHLPKAHAASREARVRNRRRRKSRALVCIVCGGRYSSGSTHPTRFCSTTCLEKARSGAFGGEDRMCEHCGARYKATKRFQRFCSRRCNNHACEDRVAEKQVRTIACASCGKSFESSRSNARFCCRRCAAGYHGHNQFRKKVSEAV
jgi:endogenous inhibitor of DNA gyrase (YacG/DUF329 family)